MLQVKRKLTEDEPPRKQRLLPSFVYETVFLPCQYNTDGWHEVRRRFEVTASTAPDLLGYGYCSRVKRWKIAVGMDENKVTPYQESIMSRGRDMEPDALGLMQLIWPEREPRAIEGMYYTTEHPWLGATPDGTILCDGKRVPLEIKCPIDTTHFSYDWRKFLKYRIQLEVQMRCMHAHAGLLFVYHPMQTCWYYWVRPHAGLWERILRACFEYRDYLRLRQKPPKMAHDHDFYERFVRRCLEF